MFRANLLIIVLIYIRVEVCLIEILYLRLTQSYIIGSKRFVYVNKFTIAFFFRFISLSERPIIANIQGQEQQFNRIIFNFYAIQNLFAIQALYLNNSQL